MSEKSSFLLFHLGMLVAFIEIAGRQTKRERLETNKSISDPLNSCSHIVTVSLNVLALNCSDKSDSLNLREEGIPVDMQMYYVKTHSNRC